MDGGWENSAARDQSRREAPSLERKNTLILENRDRRMGLFFPKTMPPGTISLILVPEFEMPIPSRDPNRGVNSSQFQCHYQSPAEQGRSHI